MEQISSPLITNDAVVFGILMIILALVFYTSGLKSGFWNRFYKIIPSVLLCYFIPALLNTFNLISGEKSSLYNMASRYLLPASLLLLTIGIDIKGLRRLGIKAVIMFFAGTLGVMLGGPIAFTIVGSAFPDILHFGNEDTWRGLATIAGSWIGGGANQAAMLEVFGASKTLFAQMIAVDVLVANIWMGLLLYGAQRKDKIDKWLRADNSALSQLEERMEALHLQEKVTNTDTRHWMVLLGIAFGVTAVSHACADVIAPWFEVNYPSSAQYSLTSSFFWLIILVTTLGMLLSFTKVKRLENYGASNIGSLFLYILVATIGMSMDLKALFDNPKFFLVGIIWILTHIVIMLIVARIIRAPFFFVAVGSQANIGGAASAPIVAAAFSKYLAPVGVLMAVLGYAVGTYGAYICGLILQYISYLIG
ncbi:DUF819 family protein [Olivibacter domesticus]|uniref:Uncharacterized membrane protein n=1 Tax=Olivibacter domesticus TaxID=407022 RepID=A0A1H7HNY0_OLID1|nr:DUF819 family protein [Olivibacter domesticus]SEK49925.1 Uncharacterized membrane protein [Olivibacter domesticus]